MSNKRYKPAGVTCFLVLLSASLLIGGCTLLWPDSDSDSGSPNGSKDPNHAPSHPDAFTSATVRAYQSESVPEEDLYMILKAGMNAPSALGTELWEYIVVQEASVLADLADEFDWLPAGTARFAIIVCANLDEQDGDVETWPIDVGFASQALRAQATKLGIASVPCRISPEDDGRIARFRELFAIPDRVVPAIVIPFGYPAEWPAPQVWDDSIVYWDSWV